MAGTFGSSSIAVPLDFKFEFCLPDINSLAQNQVITYSATHQGDCWQLEVCKKPLLHHNNDLCKFEYRLSLGRACGNARRIARVCALATEKVATAKVANCTAVDQVLYSSPMTQYSASGDKCDWVKLDTYGHHPKCKLVVEVVNCVETLNGHKPQIELPKSQMSDVLLKWFQSEDFGDATIMATDGKKFRCHREFLARRSEVFNLMFNCPMKEARENVVTIKDFDGQIVTQLLLFVYTDDCQVGPIADQLYSAAHHYQLDRLKILCESAMAANLSTETIVKTYRLATFYHLDDLKAVCVDYWESHKAEMSIEDLFAESMEIQEGNNAELN